MIELLETYLPVIFPFLFALLWVFSGLIFSIGSGWFLLAKRYKSKKIFSGKEFNGISASVGWFRYSGILTIGINQEELLLDVFLLFKTAHPRLIIPLNKITGYEKKSFFVSSLVVLEVDNLKHTNIKLSKKIADLIVEETKGNWKYEELRF